MGNSNSKVSGEKRMTVKILHERLQQEQQRRQTLLEQQGILIPPAFGVTGIPSQKGTGPSLSIQHRLLQRSTTEPLSYFTYLQESDLSTVLLNDHMMAGVWVATQASSNTNAKVYAGADGTNKLPSGAQILVEHRRNKALLQLRANLQGQSSLSASFRAHPNLSLFATSVMNGNAWAGGHFDKTFPLPNAPPRADQTELPPAGKKEEHRSYMPYEGLDIMSRDVVNLKFGAWIPVAAGDPANRPDVAQGYVAANLLGATFAGGFTSNNKSACEIKTYFSANLNDTDRPPLQITLERDCNKASIGLTQVLAFDRVQMNLLEDRAPFVRNTLAWTIRLESSKVSEGMGERTNRVLLGAAWQLNRSLAAKVVYDGSDVRTAVLFKQWKHPRVLCSVLNQWSLHGAPSFLGLGIELETGGVAEHSHAYYYSHHPEKQVVVDKDVVPQTKAVLPDDLERKV